MPNSSHVLHSILTEDDDDDGEQTSSFFKDLFNSFDENLINDCSHSPVYDTALFDVLKVDPEDFASQITLMDLPIFRSITPDELISCSWSSKAKLDKALHIVQFTRRFNQVNFWTQGELLRADILKNRTEILSHFIRIAKKLFDLNNINACMAIIMALQSAPIYRLHKTWMGLSKRDRTIFSNLKEFVSSNENWKRLREHLTNTKLPCIPYLGIYLTDIVRIDTLHPHHGGLESTQRKNSLNNICRMISEFQQSTYNFLKSIDCVQTYLSSVRYMEELQTFIEDQNFKQSLVIEPEDQLDCSTIDKSFESINHSPSSSTLQFNLLDDSDLFIDDLKSKDSCSNIQLSNEIKQKTYQCFIERRCLLKNFKKPNLSQWKKYSIIIVEHYIFFHREKSILSTIAKHFNCENEFLNQHISTYDDNPNKCQSILDWLIVRNQTKDQNEIQLSDLNRGLMYKFRFENSTLADIWFERLNNASKSPHENLIALD